MQEGRDEPRGDRFFHHQGQENLRLR
jgi:hypothetical protein